MSIRDVRWATGVAQALGRLNDRHPWSHNDAFHSWVLTRLPVGRQRAVDVGCGRGELLALLATRFDAVLGIDPDPRMRRAAAARCAGLPGVRIEAAELADVPAGADLVTMVAVLHHLDLKHALAQVGRVLAPGGRFLCVGLARPASVADHAWDVASMVTNPMIGFVRHPWVSHATVGDPPFPVTDPVASYDQIAHAVRHELPGAVMRRRLAFRHTIEWSKPAQ